MMRNIVSSLFPMAAAVGWTILTTPSAAAGQGENTVVILRGSSTTSSQQPAVPASQSSVVILRGPAVARTYGATVVNGEPSLTAFQRNFGYGSREIDGSAYGVGPGYYA